MGLVGYEVYLFSLGLYPPELVQELIIKFRNAGFYGKGEGGLIHSDSVDAIGKRTLAAMKKVSPQLFEDRHFHEAWSRGFGAKVRYVKSAVDIEGVRWGFERGTRPNGCDEGGGRGGRLRMSLLMRREKGGYVEGPSAQVMGVSEHM